MSILIDFSQEADANPYSNSLIADLGAGVRTVSGVCVGNSGVCGFLTTDVPTSTTITSKVTISQRPTGDMLGPAVVDANYNGYILRLSWDEARIYRVGAGVVGARLGAATSPGNASGDVYELEIDESTGAIISRKNGAVLETVTDTTYTGLRAAYFYNFLNNRAPGITNFEGLGYATADTTAPILSNPSVTPAWKSATTAFDTDTGEGTASAIYYLASEATDPTAAEVDGNSYAATVAHVSVAVSAAGTVTLPDPAGLTPNTEYKVKIVHTDAAGNIGELAPVPFTTLSATATFAITGAVNETDWTVILFDGAVSGNPNKLKAVSATGPDASGNLVINLDDVNVSDGQTIEGIAVDASIDKPAPLRGNVSIA